MTITVAVTDSSWMSYLRNRPTIDEVNFWTPSGKDFTGRASRDDPVLFKTKSPDNRIVGGGFKAGFWQLRVSEAWATFGDGNGVPSEAELESIIQRYRVRNGQPVHPDPVIGCLILRNVYFAPPGGEMPQPEGWGASIVRGKTYLESDPDYDYVDHVFRSMQTYARVDPRWNPDLIGVDLDEERYGKPVLVSPRLGQGSFRLAVLDAYGRRCAITGTKVEPTLEAAHIRPYALGGRHLVPNGLALRSDLHRLFDRGYLGIDSEYRLRVSPRLRSVFGNGQELYEREERGDVIALPVRPAELPDVDALAWHMDNVFLTA